MTAVQTIANVKEYLYEQKTENYQNHGFTPGIPNANFIKRLPITVMTLYLIEIHDESIHPSMLLYSVPPL